MSTLTINADRFLSDLYHLCTYGAVGVGVVRPSLSPPDVEARHWLCERMEEAGLDAQIDGVGTVFGRSPNDGPALLLGSHTDTEPKGGWLDGAFGVMAALEVARSAMENPETTGLAVDVASWIDEEGTYLGFLGARSFCGLQDMSLVDRESKWSRAGMQGTWKPTSSRDRISRPTATGSAS